MLKKAALVLIATVYIGINIWWLKIDTRLPIYDPPWRFTDTIWIWQILLHFSFNEMRNFVVCAAQPPLVGILVRPFLLFFGTNLDAAVLTMDLIFLPVLIFSMSKIIQFYTNKAWQGILGSLMLLTCPGVIFLSRFYFLDLPLMAMVALSFYLLISTREFMDRRYTISCAIAMALGNLTKLTFFIYIAAPIVLLAFKCISKRQKINFLIFLGIFSVISIAWYLPTYKTIIAISNMQYYKPLQTYILNMFYYLLAAIVLYIFFIFLIVRNHLVARIKKIARYVWISVLLLFFYSLTTSLLNTYKQDFLNNLAVFINGGIGLLNLLILCLSAFLISIKRGSKILIVVWFLVPAVFFFRMCMYEIRYILPCLPAMVVLIIVALENLRRGLRNTAHLVILLNSAFLLITYTWPVKFMPREAILISKPGIFLLTNKFWSNGFESIYGSVHPQNEKDNWYFDEFFEAIKNSGIKDGEIVWLLEGDHHEYGTASLNYHSVIRNMNAKFWSLYPNVFVNDPTTTIKEDGFRYFVDIRGFNANEKVEAARDFIKTNPDKFQIIFEKGIPGNLTVVVYKKI